MVSNLRLGRPPHLDHLLTLNVKILQKRPQNYWHAGGKIAMTETFSSNAFSGVRFVPRLAQCSSVNGLHVGRILALPPEHKQPANVLHLSARHEVSFVFNAVADVETIKIQFGAHRRPSKGVVTSTIVSSTGRVISVHSMDLISIGDNKFCSLNDLRGSHLYQARAIR